MKRGLLTTILILAMATQGVASEKRTAKVDMIACNDGEPFERMGNLAGDGDANALFVAMLAYVVAGTCVMIGEGQEYYKIKDGGGAWQVRKAGDPREYFTAPESTWVKLFKK